MESVLGGWGFNVACDASGEKGHWKPSFAYDVFLQLVYSATWSPFFSPFNVFSKKYKCTVNR